MKYSGETKIIGIVGWPLGYSLSPRFQNEGLRKIGFNALYLPLPVSPKELPALWAALKKLPNFLGLNVTQPHKEAALAFADVLSAEAKACQAVNTLYRKGGRWVGHNTDLEGFRRALPLKLKGLKISLCGAGGAARAVIQACVREGAKEIQILCRRPEQGKALLKALKLSGPRFRVETLNPSELARQLEGSEFVVNAISERDFASLLAKAVPQAKKLQGGMDLSYQAPKNPFLKALRKRSLPAPNGLGMLLEQGCLSFACWTGEKAPRKRMAKVLGH